MPLATTLGLPVGFLLGFLLEYRGFNMGAALRSLTRKGPKNDLYAYITILVTTMVAVHLLSSLGVIKSESIPFFWPAVVVGGFLFGLGMSFGTGCTNVWHGIGTGASGLVFALLGFFFGIHVIRTSLLAVVFSSLRRHILEVNGRPATLYSLVGPTDTGLQWALTGFLTVLALLWLWRSSRRDGNRDRSWLTTGLLIGMTFILAWFVARLNGDRYGLSFTQPTLALGRVVFLGDLGAFYWGAFMVIGVPIGVFVAAKRKGTVYFHMPPIRNILKLFGSGTVTGVGASIAGGCAVGHGITGVSLLSVGSITATIAAAVAIWLSTVVGRMLRRSRPASRNKSTPPLSSSDR